MTGDAGDQSSHRAGLRAGGDGTIEGDFSAPGQRQPDRARWQDRRLGVDRAEIYGSEQESVRTGDFTVLRDLGAIR